MGVFIGWSGKDTKSYLVANALRRWLEKVIQASKPWTSEQDIDAGQRWAAELFSQLDNHRVGIICVTKENKDQPWINFEAGVLAKQLRGDGQDETRVCPLLVEITENDVTGPLKLLQMVQLTRDGMFKILEMVNKHAVAEPLKESVLRDSFEKWWPDLETDLEQMKVPEQSEKSSRPVPEMLEEILGIVRSIDKAANRPSNFLAALGKDIRLVQSAGVIAGRTPIPAPVGEPRNFLISGSSTVGLLRSPSGQHCASIEISPFSVTITARRNESVTVAFAEIRLTGIQPIGEDFAKPIFPVTTLESSFSIDGAAVPGGWKYRVGYWIEHGAHHVEIPQSSSGIRKIAFLGDGDELVVVIPVQSRLFSWESIQDGPTAVLEATVWWRTRIDGTHG